MIEAAVISFLLGEATITNIVGRRIHPWVQPQRESDTANINTDHIRPCLLVSCTSKPRIQSLVAPTGLAQAFLSVKCWADTYQASKQLAEQLRLVLSGYRGSIGDFTDVHIRQQDELEAYEWAPGLDARRHTSIDCTYLVWFQEPKPTYAMEA